MKKIAVWSMSTITVVGLLLSYRTSLDPSMTGESESTETVVAAPATMTRTVTATQTVTESAGEPDASSAGFGDEPEGDVDSQEGTYTGDAVATRYGDVQVRITVADGQITSADAIEYPSENHKDLEINARAIPQLNTEATSGSVSTVSGATYTSEGYATSLQSAIDAAGLNL